MNIFQKYQQDNDKKAVLKALKAHFQIKKIHKSIEPYIFGEVAVEGMFKIDRFELCYQNIFTYDQLFGKLGDGIFPALQIGGDEYGVGFWLVMSNGKVISLHHDASFSEVASEIKTDKAGDFVKEFSRQGSIFNIKTLLDFQRLSLALGDEEGADYGRHVIEITAQSLGRSVGWLSKTIRQLPLEPIASQAQDFLDENGLKDLILAEKKVAKFTKHDAQKADLSFCFLKTLPEALRQKQNLLQLNLSGNPLRIADELAHTQLTTLELAGCDLTELPTLPASLQYLELGENDISDLTALDACPQLTYLGLINNPISEAAITAFKQRHAGCFVMIKHADFDFESDSLDLSFKKLRKLPKEIAKFKDLQHLDLAGNPKLNLATVFNTLAEAAPNLQTLNLQQCKLSDLPDELFKLQHLEKLVLERPKYGGDYKLRNTLDFNTYFAKFHRLKRLTSLPLRGEASGYSYKTDEPAYLEHLKQYKNLQILDFPKGADSKPDFFEKILAIANTLPVDTFIWDEFKFRTYTTKPRSDYIVPGLDKLSKVKHLIWNAQYRKELGPFLFDFPNLETLELRSENSFLGIPDEIARLKRLKRFKLPCLRREFHISPKIGELHELEDLELWTAVTEFPDVFAGLGQLKKLMIQNTKDYGGLKTLPESIADLHQLQELKLIKHRFEQLPKEFARLETLQLLELRLCHKIEQLPDDFGQLSNLKKLDLKRMNGLKSLPASFVDLQNLEMLEFSGRHLDYSEESKKVAQLRNLKHLHIAAGSAKFYVPESFVQLGNLRYLRTGGVADLEQALAIFTQLEKLEEIDMQSYHYSLGKRIPKSIGHFKKLKSIFLHYDKCSASQAKELFERLSTIPTLKKIKIHQWTRFLPAEISLFKQLEELNMVSCYLSTYPNTLLDMIWLKKLDFRGCNLPSADKQQLKKSLPYTEVLF